MTTNDETFYIAPANLVTVLSAFFKTFKGNPLKVVSIDEILSLWENEFGLNDNGEYQLLESDFKKFLNKINGIQVDRLFVAMDKAGQATLAHDGTELVLILNKKKVD